MDQGYLRGSWLLGGGRRRRRRRKEEEEEEEEGWAGASTKVRWLSAATVGAWCPDDEAGRSAGLARGVPNQGNKLRWKTKGKYSRI